MVVGLLLLIIDPPPLPPMVCTDGLGCVSGSHTYIHVVKKAACMNSLLIAKSIGRFRD